jgi:hypothetical protein
MAALTLVIARSRAAGIAIPDRYVLLSVPAPCAAYFAWLLYGSETARNRLANAFAIVALLALPLNVRSGVAFRDYYVSGMQAFERDLADGSSWQQLSDRHKQFLLNGTQLVERMQMLHDAKIGPLGRAAPP